MSVVEVDHQWLETYLDGELPEAEARALEARLGSDSALAAELEELRAARRMRAGVWRSLEADAGEAAAVQARLQQALLRQQVWHRRGLGIRWFAAAAASVLIGIMLGWSGRAVMEGDVAPVGGGIAAVPQDLGSGAFDVALTDEAGRVVAVQSFPTLEAARQFTSDLRQWRRQQERVRDANVVLVGDRF